MLLTENELACGVFDSTIMRGQIARSQNRRVECFELEIFHTSSGTSHIDGAEYPVRRGMFICAKPNSIRYSDFPVRCSFIRVFSNKGVTDDIEELLYSLPDCTYIDSPELIENLLSLFGRLSSYLVSISPDTREILKANSIFLEILNQATSICENSNKPHTTPSMHQAVHEVREYINEHFASDCSLSKLALTVNLSPNHLHTIFKKNIGITPYDYVMTKRINRAKTLIMTGEKGMFEIALETGFCSQSHFNKVFKEKTGTTPVEYRKQIWDRY